MGRKIKDAKTAFRDVVNPQKDIQIKVQQVPVRVALGKGIYIFGIVIGYPLLGQRVDPQVYIMFF